MRRSGDASVGRSMRCLPTMLLCAITLSAAACEKAPVERCTATVEGAFEATATCLVSRVEINGKPQLIFEAGPPPEVRPGAYLLHGLKPVPAPLHLKLRVVFKGPPASGKFNFDDLFLVGGTVITNLRRGVWSVDNDDLSERLRGAASGRKGEFTLMLTSTGTKSEDFHGRASMKLVPSGYLEGDGAGPV